MTDTTKRIVCLANSRMPGGRCVAGKELSTGEWMRFVDANGGGVPMWVLNRLRDGDLFLLDIVDVPVLYRKPVGHQRENWVFDSDRPWKKVGRISIDMMSRLVDDVDDLWMDRRGGGSKFNARVAVANVGGITDSLRLVKLDALTVRTVGSVQDPRVSGGFSFGGDDYYLWATGNEIEPKMKRRPIGSSCEFSDVYVTVSLGQPFHGDLYKLLAAVIAESTTDALPAPARRVEMARDSLRVRQINAHDDSARFRQGAVTDRSVPPDGEPDATDELDDLPWSTESASRESASEPQLPDRPARDPVPQRPRGCLTVLILPMVKMFRR